jgi:SCP-2 sterol transfer family
MPPYLSPAWVLAFNAALADLDLHEAVAAAGAGSLTASQGTFGVAQVVTDAPPSTGAEGGTLRTVLTVDAGRLTLAADPAGTLPVNVTMVLTYADAIAIARGDLEPADALAAGRVRVRGELAVLVAGQAVLQAASAALGPTLTDLTDLTDLDDATDPVG